MKPKHCPHKLALGKRCGHPERHITEREEITERGDYVLDSKRMGWEVEVQVTP